MKIRNVHDSDATTWPDCIVRTLGAPPGMEREVAPAEVMTGGIETHVPWQPDEIDVARLAHGGTIWLTVLGGLPPHRIEVHGGES